MKLRHFATLAAATLSSACGPTVLVRVDSLQSEALVGAKFIVLPGNPEVSVDDLQFQEFARYTSRALEQRGYKKAAKAETADIAIMLSYGISGPQQKSETTIQAVTTYTSGQNGIYSGSTYDSSGNYAWSNGSVSTSGQSSTSYLPVTNTYNEYTRTIILAATDFKLYTTQRKIKPLWQTTITSDGYSRDLRELFPILMGAANEYIATNTGKQVSINIRQGDDRVKVVKGELPVRSLAQDNMK